MQADSGRNGYPEEASLSSLLEICSIWQHKKSNVIEDNYNYFLHLYQVLPAGIFERGSVTMQQKQLKFLWCFLFF